MKKYLEVWVAALMAAIISLVSASAFAQYPSDGVATATAASDAPVKSAVPSLSGGKDVDAISARPLCLKKADPCNKSEDKADKKPAPELKCKGGTTGDVVLLDGWRRICRAENPVRDVVVRTPHQCAANEACYEAVPRAKFADDMREALIIVNLRLTKLEEDGEKNAQDIAKLKSDRDHLQADVKQLTANQVMFDGTLAETRKDLEDIKNRLDKVEEQVKDLILSQFTGGVGVRGGFLAGPEGLSPTLDLTAQFNWNIVPPLSASARVSGGLYHLGFEGKAIGRFTLALGPTFQLSDSVNLFIGAQGGQDVDGPAFGEARWPARDIAFALGFDVCPRKSIKLGASAQVGAREFRLPDGRILSGFFGAGQIEFSVGNYACRR